MTQHTYTLTERTAIEAESSVGNWPEAYLLAAQYAEMGGADPNVVAWLRGAASANDGHGAPSDFIRAYTAAQYMTRYGGIFNDFQVVSDEIAENVIDSILSPPYKSPTIEDIIADDIGPSAAIIFGGEADGWAGNPILLGLGQAGPLYNNILHDAGPETGDTYDALALIKFTTQDLSDLFSLAISDLDALGSNVLTVAAGIASVGVYIADAYGAVETATLLTKNIILGRVNSGDELISSLGDDIIHGGFGNDTIFANFGADLFDGGVGDDRVDYGLVSSGVAVLIDPELGGANHIATVVGEGWDELYNIEQVIGTDDDDLFQIATLVDLPLSIDGADGSDTLDVSTATEAATFDLVTGIVEVGAHEVEVANFQKYVGSDFDDSFRLNDAAEEVNAGRGDDSVKLSGGTLVSAATLDGGDGTDTVSFEALNSGIIGTFESGAFEFGSYMIENFERIRGTEYADVLTNLDNGYALDGGGGDDLLTASDDGDALYGGAGNDQLTGGDGTDFLFGDDGNDTLDGAGGSDWIDGGAGDDTFYLRQDTLARDFAGQNTYVLGTHSAMGSGSTELILDGVDLVGRDIDYSAPRIIDYSGESSVNYGGSIFTTFTVMSDESVSVDQVDHHYRVGTTNTGYDFFIDSFEMHYFDEITEEETITDFNVVHITSDIDAYWDGELGLQQRIDLLEDSVITSFIVEDPWWGSVGISVEYA